MPLSIAWQSTGPCNSALAASVTVCWLQGGCHGVSGATWSRATIPESAGSCRRPAQSLSTSVSFVTPTARATICQSMDISSCCITALELIAIRHSSIFVSVCLPPTSQNISFSPVFPWHYPLITLRSRGLCNVKNLWLILTLTGAECQRNSAIKHVTSTSGCRRYRRQWRHQTARLIFKAFFENVFIQADIAYGTLETSV